jgi:pilus assembly protein CpaE
MEQIRVVLGLEDQALAEEVLHFLDRRPGIRVVEAAGGSEGLSRFVATQAVDAAVISPGILEGIESLNGAPLLVVAERETAGALRAALRIGARGFYVWPEEREALARGAEGVATRPEPEPGTPGRVVAVYGARGGAGATFLATNLAAALAASETDTVLVDFDVFFGEVATALGIALNGRGRTLADLAPVAEELTAEHLERVLHPHPRGFRVLVAPRDPAMPSEIGEGLLATAVRLLRSRHDAVVLHLPRAVDEVTLAGLAVADVILVVATLDVLAFRDAHRLLDFLARRGLRDRCRLVVNRATRAEVVPEDAERVFGLRPSAIIAADRSILRAQNRGELVATRPGRTSRRVAALARDLIGEEAR